MSVVGFIAQFLNCLFSVILTFSLRQICNSIEHDSIDLGSIYCITRKEMMLSDQLREELFV